MAGWFDDSPAPALVRAPGWFDATTAPVDVGTEVGWWALLALDLRGFTDPVQVLTLRAVKGIALAQLAGSTESLTLRKIATAVFANTATPAQNLELRKIAKLALAGTAPAVQALALQRIVGLVLAQTLGAPAQLLTLGRVGPIEFVDTAPAAQLLEARSVGLLEVASTAFTGEALTMSQLSNIAMDASRGTGVETLAVGYRPTAATTTYIANPGAWSYTIPRWADYLDVVMVGAGSRGTNGSFFGNGAGGNAGAWLGITLDRSSPGDVPYTTKTLTGTIGAGGSSSGAAGGATSLAAVGSFGARSASGGSGQASAFDVVGKSPGNFTWNGQVYEGGAAAPTLAQIGNTPGGGSAGGGYAGQSKNGGAGGVWIRAYQA